MAIQTMRGNDTCIVGPTIGGQPDLNWLKDTLSSSLNKIQVVTLVNPGNTTRILVQDTIPICTSSISQLVALVALEADVNGCIATIARIAYTNDGNGDENVIMDGSGAMYAMAKLPNDMDDQTLQRRG
eukprot:15366652-Ditylum_brightwellii.AAC.2